MSPSSIPGEVLWSMQTLVQQINEDSFLKLKDLDVEAVLKLGRDPSAVKPIGPRQGCEGIRDNRQGILTAQITKEDSIVLRMTLLAAGFVAGPQGCSVREISATTGAKVNSWYSEEDQTNCKETGNLDVRIFLIDGPPQAVLQALHIVISAVNRYKTLVEGHCKERKVCTEQIVQGIKFFYKPPPLRAMPNAVRTFQTTKNLIQSPKQPHLVLKDPQHYHALPLHPPPSIVLTQPPPVPQPTYPYPTTTTLLPTPPHSYPSLDTPSPQPPMLTPPQVYWRPTPTPISTPKVTPHQQQQQTLLYYPNPHYNAVPTAYQTQYHQSYPVYVQPSAPFPTNYEQMSKQQQNQMVGGDVGYYGGKYDDSRNGGYYGGMMDGVQQWSVPPPTLMHPTY